MVSAYHLSVYRLISSHISIGCIVADIANSEFHMHNIFNLLSCVGNFPSSLLQYEHVRDNDLLSGNWAHDYKGKWWYNFCMWSQLNGIYHHNTTPRIWDTVLHIHYMVSLTEVC